MSNPFVYHFSQVNTTPLDGGSVKVVDSTTFAVSTAIAAAEVTVEPGAMRELHVSCASLPCAYPHTPLIVPNPAQWHPTQDEWSYYLYVVPSRAHARF